MSLDEDLNKQKRACEFVFLYLRGIATSFPPYDSPGFKGIDIVEMVLLRQNTKEPLWFEVVVTELATVLQKKYNFYKARKLKADILFNKSGTIPTFDLAGTYFHSRTKIILKWCKLHAVTE